MKKSSRILSVALALMLMVTSVSAVMVLVSAKQPFEGADEKIIDNVVYLKYKDKPIASEPGFKGTYYSVTNLCNSEDEAKKMTEISIRGEIDAIPVKTIENQPYTQFKAASIKKITVPESIVQIGERAFTRFSNLKSVALSKNLKGIGEMAFDKLARLESVSIPAGVSEIGDYTFRCCTSLKKVTFEGNIGSIGAFAFSGCKNLTKITKCKKLQGIGYGAFSDCAKLKSFSFAEGVIIAGRAFSGTGLTSVTLPAKVKLEGGKNFENCKALKKVTFKNSSAKLLVPNDCFAGCTALKTVVLPKSAKAVTLYTRAFYNCTALKTVENSGRITEVYSKAFRNCKSLESIKFSSRIRKISKDAFKGCSKLKSVTFKDTKNVPGSSYNYNTEKSNGKFEAGTFSGTPSGIKFYVKNATVAKKLKTALKGSGVKKAKIYRLSGNTLYYKNVK